MKQQSLPLFQPKEQLTRICSLSRLFREASSEDQHQTITWLEARQHIYAVINVANRAEATNYAIANKIIEH